MKKMYLKSVSFVLCVIMLSTAFTSGIVAQEETENNAEKDGISWLRAFDYSSPASYQDFYILADDSVEDFSDKLKNLMNGLDLTVHWYIWEVDIENSKYLFREILPFEGCIDITEDMDVSLYVVSTGNSVVTLSEMVSIIECFQEHKEDLNIQEIRLMRYYTRWSVQDSDLSEDTTWQTKWYLESVQYVLFNGLMTGYSKATTESDHQYLTITSAKDIDVCFEPDGQTTHAMAAQVLYNLGGRQADGSVPFTDVKRAWYYDAIAWGYQNGIVKGIRGSEFGVENNVTREQFVTMLYRYAEYCGKDVSAAADLSAYSDALTVSSYAQTAVSWAVAQGYLNGTKAGGEILLDPQGSLTRAQMAALLMRYDKAN